MKNEEVRIKNEKNEQPENNPPAKPRPEHGAESQLHNYNVMLTRLGDLFDNDEQQPPQTNNQPVPPSSATVPPAKK